MTTLRARSALLVTLPLLLLLSGCGDERSNHEPPHRSCTTSADCSSSQLCDQGTCIAEAETRLSFAFHPPGSRQDLASNWVRHVPWSADLDNRLWILEAPVPIQGTVLRGNQLTATGEQGTLFFTARNGIPGQRYRQSAQTDQDGNFALTLPGKLYTLTIVPTRDDIPASIIELEQLEEEVPLRIQLPELDEYLRWQGRVAYLDSQNTVVPLAGVGVSATSSVNGAASTSTTTAEDGSFAIYIQPEFAPYAFSVRPSPVDSILSSSSWIPSVSFMAAHPEALHPDTPLVAEVPGGGDLILGQWERARLLVGYAVDEEGSPIAGARILASGRLDESFRSSVGIPVERAAIEQHTVSDAQGRFFLSLIPGVDFRITAIETGSELRLAPPITTRVQSADTSHELTLVLQSARTTRLRIVDQNQAPLPRGTRISLQPLTFQEAPLQWYGIPGDLLAFSTTIGDDGTTSFIALDGSYTLGVESGAPLQAAHAAATVTLQAGQLNQLTLPPTSTISGVVLDTQQQPVANVTVEVWREEEQESTLAGTGATGADGRFHIVIREPDPTQAR